MMRSRWGVRWTVPPTGAGGRPSVLTFTSTSPNDTVVRYRPAMPTVWSVRVPGTEPAGGWAVRSRGRLGQDRGPDASGPDLGRDEVHAGIAEEPAAELGQRLVVE